MGAEPAWTGFVPSERNPGELSSLCEVGNLLPGREPSLDSNHAGTLILDLLASKTVKNTFLLFMSHPDLGCSQ